MEEIERDRIGYECAREYVQSFNVLWIAVVVVAVRWLLDSLLMIRVGRQSKQKRVNETADEQLVGRDWFVGFREYI